MITLCCCVAFAVSWTPLAENEEKGLIVLIGEWEEIPKQKNLSPPLRLTSDGELTGEMGIKVKKEQLKDFFSDLKKKEILQIIVLVSSKNSVSSLRRFISEARESLPDETRLTVFFLIKDDDKKERK
jgi:hypothetical protein